MALPLLNPDHVKPSAHPRAWKLRNQLTAALCFLCVLSVGAFSLMVYLQQRSTLLNGIDDQLRTAAIMAKGLLEDDYHDRITGPQSVSDADFQRVVDRYNRLCQALEMEYLWSLMVVSNRIVFTTSTSPDKIATNRKHAAFFEVHSNPELYESTFASMTPTYKDNVDKWGRIRVALVPFKDRQGRPYLFGASVRLTEVDQRLRHTIYHCVFGGLLFLAGGLAASVLLSRLVAQPLNRLTSTIQQIEAGNPGVLAEERGSHEQRLLAASFNSLNRALQDKIAALSRQEEHERITLQSIGDAVLTTDSDGRITRLNPMGEKLTGWPLAEALGRPLAEVFHIINATTREPVANPVQQVLACGEVVGLANHTALLARDGREYQISDSAAPIRDRAGQIVGAVLVFSDVTERYRAQQALRESEQSLQEAQSIAGLGSYVLDVARGHWTSSPILDQIFGIDETYQGTVENWAALIHPDDRSAMVDYFTNEVAGKGRPFDREYRIIRHHDQAARWVHGMGKLDLDAQGQPVRMHGTIQDITERKLAAIALAESEEKFSKVFRDAPVWIAITDLVTGVYVDVNEQSLRDTGFTRDEVLGHTAAAIGWISAEERARLVREVRTYGRVVSLEMSFHAKDGRRMEGLVSGEQIAIGGRPCLLTITLDITKRRQAEDSLRENRAMLQQILDTVPQAIFWKDRASVYLGCNQVFAQAVNLSSPEQIAGKTDFDLPWPRAEAEAYRADDAEVIASGIATPHIVEPLQQADGRRLWVDTTKLPLRDAHGNVNGVLGVYDDITERKRAEEAVRASEARLQAIIEAMPMPMAVSDENQNITFVNRSFIATFGYTLADIPTVAAWWPLAYPDPVYRQQVTEAWQVATDRVFLEGGSLDLPDYLVTCKDGTVRDIHFSTAPMGTSQLVIFYDVTERRQAEAALRESEERYRTLFDRANEGIFLLTADGRLTEVNRAFAEMHGYTPEELLRRHLHELDTPETARLISERMHRLLAGEALTFEVEHYHRNGHVFPLEVSASLISVGKEPLVQCFHRDITERKQAEAALRTALRDKEALLKEVHHRVKNNLQVITSLLRLESVRSEHLLTKSVLKDMQGRIRAMALLHESLYRSGQFAQVDLSSYLRQVTSKLFRALALEPDTIRFHLDLAPVWLALDQAVPCGLIVNELVANCLKHGFPEGRRGEIHITLQLVAGGPEVQLAVSDNGVGLPENFATRKAHSLGLQLVHDLARQLQGRLDAGSNPAPGSGAAFTVTFTPLPTVALPALPAIPQASRDPD